MSVAAEQLREVIDRWSGAFEGTPELQMEVLELLSNALVEIEVLEGMLPSPSNTPETIEQISKRMQPLLKGRPPEMQGAVLGDLVSLWLAGHGPKEAREAVFIQWIELVRELVPVSEEQLFGPEGHPAR